MAVAMYYRWDRDGRPITPCQPVRDIVNRLKVAYPRAAKLFSWYADDAHYQADKPQDHTPFSVTGWPVPSPYPYVFATDVMHRPDLGVDCNKLFAYWIVEARAGRMPWLKYMIWQGKSYDVRSGWVPKPASGHFDHIHLSIRTDHLTTSLGPWVLVPGTGDDMSYNAEQEIYAVVAMTPTMTVVPKPPPVPAGETPVTVPNALYEYLIALKATVDEIKAKLDTLATGGVDKATLVEAAFEGAQRAEQE